jgi:anti-anti-sigma factor
VEEQGKLRVDVQQRGGGVVVLKLEGDADTNQVDELDRELRLLSEARPAPKRVVLDLTDVPFVASIAMGVMVRFHQSLTKSGGKVVLAGARPLVADSFRRANLERLFQFFDSPDEAAKS